MNIRVLYNKKGAIQAILRDTFDQPPAGNEVRCGVVCSPGQKFEVFSAPPAVVAGLHKEEANKQLRVDVKSKSIKVHVKKEIRPKRKPKKSVKR